ncbi:MAG: hypothetical protein ACKVS8_08345 [Phycisphaerales bacterium]
MRSVSMVGWRGGLALVVGVAAVGGRAAHGQDLLVSSRFSNTIIRYNGQTGALVGTFASGPQLRNPNGIAYGPDGNLYVGLGDAGSILRYNGQTGAFMNTFVAAGSGGLASVRDIAFGPDGNLYANSGGSNRVLKFNGSTGAFVSVAAQLAGAVTGPVGLTLGADGSVFVGAATSNRAYRFGPGNAFLRSYHPGTLSNTTGVALGADGMLYVAMSVSNVIARFNPTTGLLLGTFGAGSGLNIPIYMTVAPGGDLLVGSFATDNVLRFDPVTGTSRGVFIAAGLGGLDGTHDLVFMPVPGPGALAACVPAAIVCLARRRR